ncbi:MAG: hypothetical protein ACQ5SW_03385 [Sphaerochaetaceae bacterium]
MQIGRWRNFEELEESLTLDELLALYSEATDRERRQTAGVAQAFGAEVEIEYGPKKQVVTEQQNGGDVLEGIFGRASERLGKNLVEDKQTKVRNEFAGMGMAYSKH